MFTGIIEEMGELVALRRTASGARLEVKADKVLEGVKIGDSVSVDGVCLTVVALKDRVIAFDVMAETMRITTLRKGVVGARLNLERALKAGDRIGGHFVMGHVDAVGVIRSKKTVRGNLEFHIAVPEGARKFLVPKGSIAVDGISLTIAAMGSGGFKVGIIPYTAAMTTLGFKGAGAEVNIECDILAKRPSL